MQYRKVIKIGGGLYVNIPKKMSMKMRIRVGDPVRVSFVDPGVMIVKAFAVEMFGKVMSKVKQSRGGEVDG